MGRCLRWHSRWRHLMPLCCGLPRARTYRREVRPVHLLPARAAAHVGLEEQPTAAAGAGTNGCVLQYCVVRTCSAQQDQAKMLYP